MTAIDAFSDQCHCGEVTAYFTVPFPVWVVYYADAHNKNMMLDFCETCWSVRCDAFPGACKED